MRALLDSTRHVKARGSHYFRVSALRQGLVHVCVVAGNLVVAEAKRTYVLPDAEALANSINGAANVV